MKGGHFHGYFRFADEGTIVYKYLTSVDKGQEIEIVYDEVH